MPPIYGPDGAVVSSAMFKQPQAEPDVTGIRSVWHDPVASGLTPQRLAHILRDAAEGELREFLVLAEEMEEREPHYFSVLSTRKRAITELKPVIEAATEEGRDVAIADEVRAIVRRPAFTSMVAELTDALGKGFAVCEIIWSTTGSRWDPREYRRRDPTFFQFDRRTGSELRLISPADPDGEPLRPWSFIVHYPRLKSGLPGRGGLARIAVWSFMLKSFTLKDWMAFLEVYGLPFRVGKYGPGATEREKDALLRAVRDIAGDAAAIMPKSMDIDFIETTAASGSDAFEKKARYVDEQISKIVLGQTTTTDAISGGHAVSKEHNEVRHDILRSDARVLAATIQQALIEPFVSFHHGPQENYPTISFPVEEPEDVKTLMEVTERFVNLGGKVSMAEARDRIGWQEPSEDEELLAPARAPAAVEPATARARFRCDEIATAREATVDDELEELMMEALGDWEKMTDPLLAPLRRAVEAASDYEDLRARLNGAVAEMDTSALVEALARATAKARGLGDVRD